MGLFYWHSKAENGKTLKEELLSFDKTNIVKIATAYFSEEGLTILKEMQETYSLKKNNIYLYLSPEFSLDKPHELFEKLKDVCQVYIVFNIRFHPKVYWLKSSSKSKLIFGSSNFTGGGFKENIEFDSVSEVDKNEEVKLENFFGYCKDNSEVVNDEMIKYYQDKAAEIEQLKRTNRKINKALYSYQKRDDEFEEDDYDLKDMYFTYEDYETLFLRNQGLSDTVINAKRKKIQDKILNIHRQVYPELNKKNIHCHWRTENITSLIRPCEFNFGQVGWIGTRYGKSKDEIDALNSWDGDYGFQKHACLQFCINYEGFAINLFHAVRKKAIDRDYLHDNIDKLKGKIIKELDKLKGQNMVWLIYDIIEDMYFEFKIDDRKSEEFIGFYKENDKEGRTSCLE